MANSRWRNFLRGAGSILVLFPVRPKRKPVTLENMYDGFKKDQENLAKDFEKIGKSFKWPPLD